LKFNALIPELSVSDLSKSLRFYIDLLGFKVEYDRPADKFSFLSLDSAQLMLEQTNHHWATAPLERPYGRGINFQIEVSDLGPMLSRLAQAGHPLFREARDNRYQVGDRLEGRREFLVMDPDGYLLRFCQSLGPA
jgi:catechol 2,3-dioxygenase-like lactoylglutathione lyase family enzyme